MVLVLVATLFFACGGDKETNSGSTNSGASSSGSAKTETLAPDEYSGKIVVWSFTDEVGNMIDDFNAVYPNVEVEYVVIPNDDEVYLNKINTTLRSRSATPDVFTGEAAYYKQFIDAGYWEPLSGSPYNAEALLDDLIDYVPNSSRDANGEITALSWQATPGALFYRRSIAKEVLGTDDPAEVSKYTSSLDGLYELGEMVKETYGGDKYLFAGYGDMSEFIYNLREGAYIQDNKLVIPDGFYDYMNMAKDMRENEIEAGAGTWSPPWFSSMADASVMCYILPTWGLHYVLKPNAEPEANEGNAEFTGDWGLATPPASYSWGGTWVGINRLSKEKDLAWLFVEFVGSNPDFLKTWALETGDFVANMTVVDAIKDDFSEPFLGGQNHYEYFAQEASKIDVSHRGPWDLQIQNAWGDQVELYANGDKDFDTAVADFKKAVQEILPDVEVD